MNPALLALGAKSTLQTHPNTASWMFLHSGDGARTLADGKPHSEGVGLGSVGTFAGLLVSTGRKMSGSFECGGWSFSMAPDQEQLALVVDPKALATCDALELFVYPLDREIVLDDDPTTALEPQLRLRSERPTTWEKVDGLPQAARLADGVRGLGVRADAAGRWVMDWFHTADASVFQEIGPLVKRWRSEGGARPALRIVLRRDPARSGTWYRARETIFETL